MKIYSLLIALFLFSCNTKKEAVNQSSCENCKEVIFGTDDLDVVPDHFASYPNGGLGIQEFISKNLNYPQAAKSRGEQGKVILSFIVSTEGNVVDVKVVKSVSPELDAEALRVVKLMNGWQPAIKDGRLMNIEYKLPIKFTL